MKLLHKNILLNAVISLLILCIGEFALFHLLESEMEKETEEHLNLERIALLRKVKKGADVESFRNNIGDKVDVILIPSLQYNEPIIENIEMEEEFEEEHFTSKKIVFDLTQNNKNYRVSISKTIDEDEDLMSGTALIIFLSAGAMLLLLILANVWIYNQLFHPVYELIREIKKFSFQNGEKIKPPKTNTREFVDLGCNISLLSEKIISDFNAMKEFTEDMTHEIQTPLTIINFKIERCLQDENLSEQQALLLVDAQNAVTKLFNISKGLTLLSKLENKQYPEISQINLKEFIPQRIRLFSDFIEDKNLNLELLLNEDVLVSMHPALCEVLIDNILKNAIKHNLPNGKLLINLNSKSLVIANSGMVPQQKPEEFFARFKKTSEESLGLGLSIIKKITEYYGFFLSYTYENELHTVRILFRKQ